MPAITLPGFKGERGLPIGVQLVGRSGADVRRFSAARWFEAKMRAALK